MSFEHSMGCPLYQSVREMIRVQQKALVLLLWRTRAAYALYACRGTTTIYPVRGLNRFASLIGSKTAALERARPETSYYVP